MSRYAPAVRADWFDDIGGPLIPAIQADDHRPVNTGLLYPNGEPIMRLPNPVGFGRDGEW